MATGQVNNGTSLQIDPTLTIEGLAADAKITGDRINNKLSITGGTVTGKITIKVSGSDVIKISGSDDNIAEEIKFERTDTGATLTCGVGAGGDNMGLWDTSNGKWIINSKATTGDVYIGGTLCKGFVTAYGSKYTRFSDGTQLCWGYTNKITAGEIFTATFPVAFSAAPSVTINRYQSATNTNVNGNANVCNITTTEFLAVLEAGTNSTWLAIGRWK